MSPHLRIDRRKFTESLLAISGAATATVLSKSAAEAADKPAEESNNPKTDEKSKKKESPPPEELMLLSVLLQRYPSENFDEAAIRGIYMDIRADVARGRILSQFPLLNSDEPAFVFTPTRGHGSGAVNR